MPFPAPLGNRIAYDRDGTAAFIRRDPSYGGEWVNIHPDAVRALNSSNGAGLVVPKGDTNAIWEDRGDVYQWMAFVFPEPMRISGIFFQSVDRTDPDVYGGIVNWRSSPGLIYASPNTTNGVDGDWSELGLFDSVPLPYATNNPGTQQGVHALTGDVINAWQTDSKSFYRQVIPFSEQGQQSAALLNARGLRIRVLPNTGYYGSYDKNDRLAFKLHLYGHPDIGASGNILAAWHPTLDHRVPPIHFQWEADRPSVGVKQFRVKNLSSSAAYDVVLSAEDEYGAPVPSPAASLQFSSDGLAWSSTFLIDSIPSDSVSSVLYVRRTTLEDDPLGSHSVRINMDVGEWS